jgi:AmmeMemoRadiSam system protein B
VPEPLPRLRMTLDFMPSPSPEHPGLLIRDPYRFSDAMLIIPPALVECLGCFDGLQSELDLRKRLVELTGEIDLGGVDRNLIDTLSAAGFLEDDAYSQMREHRVREFAASPLREPAHAGSAYPADTDETREVLNQYMSGATTSTNGSLFAIAAPHVSPEGGWRSYRAAYSQLRPEHKNRTFVILATSHYGEAETFGLTRKPFRTPLGDAQPDLARIDWLASKGGDGIRMEDYCHSFEHTVELQVIFLQHMLGPDVKILPVLIGSFAHSIYQGGKPEHDTKVRAFFDAMGELGERDGDDLFYILGVDMAHMGVRYQDRFEAVAGEGRMMEVEARDRARIDRINSLDADGYWDLVQENQDDLKWCGSSPFYTFLKTSPKAKGDLLHYEQWNIDDRSVVSFAGIGFNR